MSQQENRQEQAEAYIREMFVKEDEPLRNFKSEVAAAGMPTIQVPPELGKMLSLIVRMIDARRILEIGTLGGYSATWMARTLPKDGSLISLEKEPRHAEFARRFLERTGVSDKVEIIVGAALDTLPTLAQRENPSFDLVFIDADKSNYPGYLDWALRLTHPGSVIVGDNVLRGGKVVHPDSNDPDHMGLSKFNQHIANSPLLDSLLIPNRGGNDGYLIAVVKEES